MLGAQGLYELLNSNYLQYLMDIVKNESVSGVEKTMTLFSTPQKEQDAAKNRNSDAGFAAQTPQKTTETSQTRFKDIEFPPKYKDLVELFDGMTRSLRLLALFKKAPTFLNICSQVEVWLKRKLCYVDLGRMKYMLPEAVKIDRILVHDLKTSCAKSDMKITLLFDVVEGHDEPSAYIALHKLFVARLVRFSAMHPEDTAIPEAKLPVEVSQRFMLQEKPLVKEKSHIVSPQLASLDSGLEVSSAIVTENPTEKIQMSSHFPPSFIGRLFKKGASSQTEKTQLLASPIRLSSSTSLISLNSDDLEKGLAKESEIAQQEQNTDTCSEHPQPEFYASFKSPSQRVVSLSDDIVTPAQSTRKKSMSGQKGKPAKRTLNFSVLEGDKSAVKSLSDEPKSPVFQHSRK